MNYTQITKKLGLNKKHNSLFLMDGSQVIYFSGGSGGYSDSYITIDNNLNNNCFKRNNGISLSSLLKNKEQYKAWGEDWYILWKFIPKRKQLAALSSVHKAGLIKSRLKTCGWPV